MNSFFSKSELKEIGLGSVGKNVLISRYARFYSPEKITIGDNVRIDDFCILSGRLKLGSHIHISSFVVLYGSKGIELEDYTGISSRSTLFSATNDFSGDFLVGPIHPPEKTKVTGGKIILKRFSHIGAHCIIFPNLTIGEGTVIGACSLVKDSTDDWGIYAGVPAKRIKERNRNLKKLCY